MFKSKLQLIRIYFLSILLFRKYLVMLVLVAKYRLLASFNAIYLIMILQLQLPGDSETQTMQLINVGGAGTQLIIYQMFRRLLNCCETVSLTHNLTVVVHVMNILKCGNKIMRLFFVSVHCFV